MFNKFFSLKILIITHKNCKLCCKGKVEKKKENYSINDFN
jgi:hypothetical protein